MAETPHVSAMTMAAKSRRGVTFVDGLVWVCAAAFAGLQWMWLFAPPRRALGWLSVALAALGPLVLIFWLHRRYGQRLWQLSALSTSILSLTITGALGWSRDASCVVSCGIFPFQLQVWRGVSWSDLLAFQGGVGVVCGLVAFGILRRHWKVGLCLLIAQGAAWWVALDGAYLGLPAWTSTRTFIVDDDQNFSFEFDYDRWIQAHGLSEATTGGWETSLAFQMERSFEPEAYYVLLQWDREGDGRMVSLRTLVCGDEPIKIDVLERRLSRRRVQRLRRQLTNLDLGAIDPGGLGSTGLDGSIWALTGHLGEQTLDLRAWSPNYERPYGKPQENLARRRVAGAGRVLLAASGFAVCERRLY